MESIRYHRQLSRSIYIWGIFTPRDFGLLSSPWPPTSWRRQQSAHAAHPRGYPAYLAALRLGRPPGFDVHLFRSWFLPRHFRPGREERPSAHSMSFWPRKFHRTNG